MAKIIYNLSEINDILWDLHKSSCTLDFHDSKYNTLLEFLSKYSPGEVSGPPILKKYSRYNDYSKSVTLDRNSFGGNDKKPTIFKVPDNSDDEIRCKINSISCKISESNSDYILSEFMNIKFGEVEDISKISYCLHKSLISCSIYRDQILKLVNYLTVTYPDYQSNLESEFLEYSKIQFDKLYKMDESSVENWEEITSLRKFIMTNYELIVMYFTKGLLFNTETIDKIISDLYLTEKIIAIEILIKFLIILKTNKCSFPVDIVDNLVKIIKERKYPKRLDIMLMELE